MKKMPHSLRQSNQSTSVLGSVWEIFIYNIYWLFYTRHYTEGFYVLMMIIRIITNPMFSTYHTHLAESMGTWSESPSGPVLVLVHTCTSTIPYKVLSDYFWAAWGSDSRAFPCTASFGIFPVTSVDSGNRPQKHPPCCRPKLKGMRLSKVPTPTHRHTLKALELPCAAFLSVF